VHLTSCTALSSDSLPVHIQTMCPTTFQHPTDRPDLRGTDWANFQTPMMPRLEVRNPHPCPEAAGVSNQVSSPTYG
jgi:hypothetical protein